MFRRRMVLLPLLVSVLACCGDGGTGPGVTLDGSYSLVKVDGQSLPVTWTTPSGELARVESGSLEIDGTVIIYTLSIFNSDDSGATWEDFSGAETGTLTREGKLITLDFGSWFSLLGTWNGSDRITLLFPGPEDGTSMTMVYRRTLASS